MLSLPRRCRISPNCASYFGRLQAAVVPRIDLGGDKQLAARRGRQHSAQHCLGATLAIDVRGIELIVTRGGESREQGFGAALVDLVAEGHGTQD